MLALLLHFPANAKRTNSPLIYYVLLTGILSDEDLDGLFSPVIKQKLPATLGSNSLFV